MAKLKDHRAASVTKMMLIGDGGSGKTGALASLARAGYNVRILDLDNGVDVLFDLLGNPSSPQYDLEALGRVDYVTLTDKMKNVNGKLIPAKASVWQRAVQFLDTGKIENEDGTKTELGPISSWTPKEVLAIDSLSMLSNGAMNFVLSMNARIGQRPHQSDWGDAQVMLETLMQMLYDEQVNCNIVVNTHIVYIGEEGMPQRGYPACAGNKLPQKIGRYFNSVVMAKSEGAGTAQKHKILTNSQPLVELKTSAPSAVKASYPIETGLAEFFKAVQGQSAEAPK